MSNIKDAMGEIERNSCLKFKEKDTDDDDFVEIHVCISLLSFILSVIKYE